MTKEEIKEWLKTAHYVDCEFSDHDKCYNHMEDRIYEKDGNFFKVYFMNEEPESCLDPVTKEKDYKLFPVIKKTRVVEEVYYE